MRIIVMAAQALSDIHRRPHCAEPRSEARTTIAVRARLPILDSVNCRSTNPGRMKAVSTKYKSKTGSVQQRGMRPAPT
ncbi:hypothetical protein MRX96_003408 [Rhipicephalus microplus]